MNNLMTSSAFGLILLATASSLLAGPAQAGNDSMLAGTWILVAADQLHGDGTRTRDYGAAPKGRLQIDSQGRYSLQIFKSERPSFASGAKLTGSAAEFEAAVLGSSTHFGSVNVNTAAQTLTFIIDGASFPNWEGTQQKRRFTLKGKRDVCAVIDFCFIPSVICIRAPSL